MPAGEQPVAESSRSPGGWWKMLPTWKNWSLGDFPGKCSLMVISAHWNFVLIFDVVSGIYSWPRERRRGTEEDTEGAYWNPFFYYCLNCFDLCSYFIF